jgi:serine protease Do
VIVQCGTTRIEDGVDLERSLLQVSAGRPISVVVSRGGSPLSLNLAPAKYEGRTATVARRSLGSQKSRTVNLDDSVSNRSWRMLGLKLAPTSDVETRVVRERYNGGMRIIDVRGNSPAYQNGIRKGDILVGLHEFETKSLKDLEYILNKASNDASELRFRVLRGRDEVFGSLSLKAAAASDESTATR